MTHCFCSQPAGDKTFNLRHSFLKHLAHGKPPAVQHVLKKMYTAMFWTCQWLGVKQWFIFWHSSYICSFTLMLLLTNAHICSLTHPVIYSLMSFTLPLALLYLFTCYPHTDSLSTFTPDCLKEIIKTTLGILRDSQTVEWFSLKDVPSYKMWISVSDSIYSTFSLSLSHSHTWVAIFAINLFFLFPTKVECFALPETLTLFSPSISLMHFLNL